ncbi:hypothetical protein HY251_10650 [bacterium]|nr:hypothetical protein [bacterium]
MPSKTLTHAVRRATRRARAVEIERALLQGGARGLAAATAALLLAAALLALLRPSAPLGDEARIAALALATALAASGLGVGLARGLARRATPLEAAFALDRALGLEASIPAALELEGSSSPLAQLSVLRAREALEEADLARIFPRKTTAVAFEAALLLSGAAALALVIHDESAPLPPLPFGPAAFARTPPDEVAAARSASRVLALSARELAPRARETDAPLGEAGPATRAVREVEKTARALARGTPDRKATLARLASARGVIESERMAGLGDALASAASALEASPALKGLARALVEGDRPGTDAIRERARDLAERARAGTLGDEAEQSIASAAARAARALDGTPGGKDAKAALEQLSRKLDESAPGDEKAAAAQRLGDALAKARAAAASDEVAARSLGALEDARDALRGERRASPREEGEGREEGKPGAGGLARATDKKPARPRGGTGGGKSSSGEKKETKDATEGGSGERRDAARRDGDPMKGAGLGPRVAGKGGSNEERKPDSPLPDDERPGPGMTASLAGILGERGASLFFAISGLASGSAPTDRQRELLREFRRSEEEALERELVPLDERRLVRRYFDALSSEDSHEK